MKYLYTLLVFAFALFLFNACEKKAIVPAAPPEKAAPIVLPDSLKVNYSGNKKYKIQSVTYSGHTLRITGTDSIADTLYTFYMNVKANRSGAYPLSYSDTASIQWIIYHSINPTPYYITDTTHTGTINLTLLDTIGHLASGTFAFHANDPYPPFQGDTAVVSGSFANLKW